MLTLSLNRTVIMLYSDNPELDAQRFIEMVDSRKESNACQLCDVTGVPLTNEEVFIPDHKGGFNKCVRLVCEECYEWWKETEE
jgi:hypothetical protein